MQVLVTDLGLVVMPLLGSKLQDLQVLVGALFISNIFVDCVRDICSYFLLPNSYFIMHIRDL